MITDFRHEHLEQCVGCFTAAYNGEPWNNHWTTVTATRYLQELVRNPRFVGLTLWHDSRVIGAVFCHERTWWNNDELYIDELFIVPDCQRQGYGTQLLASVERLVREKKLAGITLLTDRRMPSADFYNKNGFCEGSHIVFMYKVV